MVAASVQYDRYSMYTKKEGQMAFAVAVGVISIVGTTVALVLSMFAQYSEYVVLFLTAWWIAGVGVTTFDYPFLLSGVSF
jgi:hypothetical protein